MSWKERIQRAGHRRGVHVTRWPPDSGAGWRRRRLLEWLEVSVLFDVGANVGQYARAIRSAGFRGQIVSFEPVAAAFRQLEAAARDDPNWAVRHLALGSARGETEINVAAGLASSSILPMGRRYLRMLPRDRYIGSERIGIETLDSAAAEFLAPAVRVAMKLDVQGYELEVLRGGSELLSRAAFVECEMAFVELYRGQTRFEELIEVLYSAGLRLAAFDPGHTDEETGALMWADGIFVRDG